MNATNFEVPLGHAIPTGAKIVGIRPILGSTRPNAVVQADTTDAVKALAADPSAARMVS